VLCKDEGRAVIRPLIQDYPAGCRYDGRFSFGLPPAGKRPNIIGSGKSGGYFVAAGEGPAQDMGGAAKSEIYAANKAKKTCIQPFGMIN
jgi:hypothetical protein